jgi:protein SCO1/2
MQVKHGGLVLLALALLGLGGALSWYLQDSNKSAAPLDIAGIHLPTPRPISEFSLQSADGEIFSLAQLQQRWTFLYFGYTFCPDACPLALSQLNVVDKKLSQQNPELWQAMAYVLISVDPRRDTPQRLAEYTAYFNPRFQGASGEPAALEQLAKPLGIYYAVPENPEDPENYLVDHSSALILVNPDGKLQAVFSAPHDPARIIDDFLAIQQRWSS